MVNITVVLVLFSVSKVSRTRDFEFTGLSIWNVVLTQLEFVDDDPVAFRKLLQHLRVHVLTCCNAMLVSCGINRNVDLVGYVVCSCTTYRHVRIADVEQWCRCRMQVDDFECSSPATRPRLDWNTALTVLISCARSSTSKDFLSTAPLCLR